MLFHIKLVYLVRHEPVPAGLTVARQPRQLGVNEARVRQLASRLPASRPLGWRWTPYCMSSALISCDTSQCPPTLTIVQ